MNPYGFINVHFCRIKAHIFLRNGAMNDKIQSKY